MITYEQWQKMKEGFCGTENYHKLNTLYLSDGAKAMAENLGCFWLFNNIELYDFYIGKYKFLSIKVVSRENKAVIDFQDGNEKSLMLIPVPYTDLPEGEYKIWAVEGDINGKKAFIAYLPEVRVILYEHFIFDINYYRTFTPEHKL